MIRNPPIRVEGSVIEKYNLVYRDENAIEDATSFENSRSKDDATLPVINEACPVHHFEVPVEIVQRSKEEAQPSEEEARDLLLKADAWARSSEISGGELGIYRMLKDLK
jgi:hypothetical protein